MLGFFRISSDILPDGAEVVSFEGEEAVNSLYHLHILFSLPLAAGLSLDLDGAVGSSARFEIGHDAPVSVRGSSTAETRPHSYSGLIASLELVDDLATTSVFRLHLVPRAWKLSLGEHSRVFVDTALPDILRQTLEDGGLGAADYDLRLARQYSPIAHVCQARESRLRFVTRWLSRVGAYYFFEQGDAQERLVITDDRSSHWPSRGAMVRFYPRRGADVSAGEALRTFRLRKEVAPRNVQVVDYSPLHPQLQVKGAADIVPAGAGGEVHLFDVSEPLPEGAQHHADARAGERLAAHTVCEAEGSVLGLSPGFTFELTDHPRSDLNRSWLVIEMRHGGSEPRMGGAAGLRSAGEGAGEQSLYFCRIKAVDADQHYHPPHTTPWPRISGTVRARIDGEAESEYAQLDEHGRYRVRLMLDESGLPDGTASTRVRMIQPHAGTPEGMHLPLRKGTEVQVGFLRGDPDQPVIVGVMPNAVTPSPVTQANRTMNVVQTGGLSRVEIDDNQGSEYIDVSTPPEKTFMHLGAHAGLGSHNYVLSTDGDYAMHTGGNRDIKVSGKQTESVTGDVNETYHSNQTTTVDSSLTETIDSGSTQTIHAGSTQTIDGGAAETITGGETRTVTGGQKEALDGGRTQTITGSSVEVVTGNLSQTVTGGSTITTPANYTVLATAGFELSTTGTATLIANGGFNLLAPGGQTRLDEDFTQFGGEYKVFSNNQLIVVGHRIDLRGLYVELVGLKADFYGLKSTTGGTLWQGALAYLGTDGYGATAHGLSQLTSGFQGWG